MPLAWGGSNALSAYISKPKPKPVNASRLWNWNLKTSQHKQPTRFSQIRQTLQLYSQSKTALLYFCICSLKVLPQPLSVGLSKPLLVWYCPIGMDVWLSKLFTGLMCLSLSRNNPEHELVVREVSKGTASLPEPGHPTCKPMGSLQLLWALRATPHTVQTLTPYANVHLFQLLTWSVLRPFAVTSFKTALNLPWLLVGIYSPTSPTASWMFHSEYSPSVFRSTYLTAKVKH